MLDGRAKAQSRYGAGGEVAVLCVEGESCR